MTLRGSILATVVCAAVIGIGAATDPRAGSSSSVPAPRDPLATETCASCHPAEWSEWQTSRHAQAWRDPIFQAEFARGRHAWCVGCHAPSAPDPTAPVDADPRVAQGVGCAACHERQGRMVSTRRAPSSPHDTLADPGFGSPAFCAGCHEFNFPILGEHGHLVRYTDEPMQATVAEWRASGATMTCIDCHADGAAGHEFRGSHEPDRVAAALEIRTCRDGDAVEVTLANEGAAHNVPSGGVHRRMVLRAWRSTAPERMAEHTFGRRFRPLTGGGKETIADTTIAPGRTQRARFRLAALGDGRRDRAVNLELRYIYALDEHVELAGTDISNVIWHVRADPDALARCAL